MSQVPLYHHSHLWAVSFLIHAPATPGGCFTESSLFTRSFTKIIQEGRRPIFHGS